MHRWPRFPTNWDGRPASAYRQRLHFARRLRTEGLCGGWFRSGFTPSTLKTLERRCNSLVAVERSTATMFHLRRDRQLSSSWYMAGVYYVLDCDSGRVVREIECDEAIFSSPVVGKRSSYTSLRSALESMRSKRTASQLGVGFCQRGGRLRR